VKRRPIHFVACGRHNNKIQEKKCFHFDWTGIIWDSQPKGRRRKEFLPSSREKMMKATAGQMGWKWLVYLTILLAILAACEGQQQQQRIQPRQQSQRQRPVRDGIRRQRRHRTDKAKLIQHYLKKNGRLEGMVRIVDGVLENEGTTFAFSSLNLLNFIISFFFFFPPFSKYRQRGDLPFGQVGLHLRRRMGHP
jgi:hypothetical protein